MPLALSVVASPLTPNSARPSHQGTGGQHMGAAAKFSVAPGADCHGARVSAAQLRLNVAASTCRVPLLLNGTVTMVLAVPAVWRKSPDVVNRAWWHYRSDDRQR